MPRSRVDILNDLARIDTVDTVICYLCRTSSPNSNIGNVRVCDKCYRKFQLLKEIEHNL